MSSQDDIDKGSVDDIVGAVRALDSLLGGTTQSWRFTLRNLTAFPDIPKSQYPPEVEARLRRAHDSICSSGATVPFLLAYLAAWEAMSSLLDHQGVLNSIREYKEAVRQDFVGQYLAGLNAGVAAMSGYSQPDHELEFHAAVQNVNSHLLADRTLLDEADRDQYDTLTARMHGVIEDVQNRVLKNAPLVLRRFQQALLDRDWDAIGGEMRSTGIGVVMDGYAQMLEHAGHLDLAESYRQGTEYVQAALSFLRRTRAYPPLPFSDFEMEMEKSIPHAQPLGNLRSFLSVKNCLTFLSMSPTPAGLDSIVNALKGVLECPIVSTSRRDLGLFDDSSRSQFSTWCESNDAFAVRIALDIWLPVYYAGLLACGSSDARKLVRWTAECTAPLIVDNLALRETMAKRVEHEVDGVWPNDFRLGHAAIIASAYDFLITSDKFDADQHSSILRQRILTAAGRDYLYAASPVFQKCAEIAQVAHEKLGITFVQDYYQEIGLIPDHTPVKVPTKLSKAWWGHHEAYMEAKSDRVTWTRLSNDIGIEASDMCNTMLSGTQIFVAEELERRWRGNVRRVLVARRVLLGTAKGVTDLDRGLFLMGFIRDKSRIELESSLGGEAHRQYYHKVGLLSDVIKDPLGTDGLWEEERRWYETYTPPAS